MILLEIDIQHLEGKQSLEKEGRGSIGREGGSCIDVQIHERWQDWYTLLLFYTTTPNRGCPAESTPCHSAENVNLSNLPPELDKLSRHATHWPSNDLSRSLHSNHCCCRAIPAEAEAATWATQYRDKLDQRTDLYDETIWQRRGKLGMFYNALPNFLGLASQPPRMKRSVEVMTDLISRIHHDTPIEIHWFLEHQLVHAYLQ